MVGWGSELGQLLVPFLVPGSSPFAGALDSVTLGLQNDGNSVLNLTRYHQRNVGKNVPHYLGRERWI